MVILSFFHGIGLGEDCVALKLPLLSSKRPVHKPSLASSAPQSQSLSNSPAQASEASGDSFHQFIECLDVALWC